MEYLSHYIEQGQTDAFNKYGAFFAFSDKQFNESKVDGVVYASLGAGLIAPKDNTKALKAALDSVWEAGIAADIKENGVKGIIHRELANHECQITMDYSDAVSAVAGHGITEKQVAAEWSEFWNTCVDNDYF